MSADEALSDLQFGLRQMKTKSVPGHDGGRNRSQHPAVEAAVEDAPMNPVTLYRGTSDFAMRGPGEIASFTDRRPIAQRFAGERRGARVMKFKPGTLPAIRVQDHLPAEEDQKEREWVARIPHYQRSAP